MKLIPTSKIQKLATLEISYKKIKEEREQLRAELLETMQELDVESLKTGSYTLYRAKRITPQVTNMDFLEAQLELKNIPYETMRVFTPQTFVAFRLLAKEKRVLDGLEFTETEYVVVKPKEKSG